MGNQELHKWDNGQVIGNIYVKTAVLAIALIFAIAASTLLADITLVLFEYQKLAGERS